MKKTASPNATGSLPARGRTVSFIGRRKRSQGRSPTGPGFRRAGLALAVAAACLGTSNAFGQPSGAQVLQGQAQLLQQGTSLVVTTQNAAGTNRSVINWQSFSVPAGSTTRFDQPNAQSLSINRVTGSDPSAIYGTLSSNGRLVLVNPAGIAVGAGAVVDTAGFTASTLRLSEADALAGRLVFGGDGLGGGPLKVDGQIVARSGDVVLIAPNVQVGAQALVQAPGGATMLAAGQKVELTGRGLEGITLQVQAPADQAVNLGTLQGDAVGIFAAQLKHSGLIQATAVSAEGGKVVLKGQQVADISGTIEARNGDMGGQVHVTAEKVMLRSGAVIDVSGPKGGGEALIGGGWQGKDSRVANAQRTLVDGGVDIRANATDSGNGGTVVVWSDDVTAVAANIEARGGPNGGNGGNVETSGKGKLVFLAHVDNSAPKGQGGTLLLDPDVIDIVGGTGDGAASPDGAGTFKGNGTAGTVNFTDADITSAGVSQIYQSELEGLPAGTNIILEATNYIGTSGTFTASTVNLPLNASLTMRTRNSSPGDSSTWPIGIDLTGSNDGSNLEFKANGTGSITLQTGTGSSPWSADISVGKLTAGGNVTLAATGYIDVYNNVQAGGDISLTTTGGGIYASSIVASGGGQIYLESDQGAISLYSSTLTTSGGNITLKAGENASSYNYANAVNITDSTLKAPSTASGAGTIDITGVTGPGAFGVQISGNVELSAGNGTTITGVSNPSLYYSGGGGIHVSGLLTGSGALTLNGSGDSDYYATGIHMDGASISHGSGALTINGTLTGTMGGDAVQIVWSQISTTSRVSIEATSGDLEISDATVKAGPGGLSLNATGGSVMIARSTLDTSVGAGGGDIRITGLPSNPWADGVHIEDASSVHAGTGYVIIEGTSASGYGFYFDTNAPMPATISGANVSITGTQTPTSLGSGYAALSINNELVSASSSVTLKAIGGDLEVLGSTIQAGSGGMSLTASGTGAEIVISYGSSYGSLLKTTSGGAINISAPSGDVYVSGSSIASGNGAISIQAGQTAPTPYGSAIYIEGSPIDAGSSTILISGHTASNDSYDNESWGVNFYYYDATLNAGGGTTIIGTHVGSQLLAGSGGVRLPQGATLTVTGGPLTVTGTALVPDATGVVAQGTIVNAAGAVSITGNGGDRGVDLFQSTMTIGAGGLNIAGNSVYIGDGGNGGSMLTVSGGDTTLQADTMDLQGSSGSINAGGGIVTVKNFSTGRAIDLGSTTDAAAALELSQAELDAFANASALSIGSATAGLINISAPISIGSLTLQPGGAFSLQGSGIAGGTGIPVHVTTTGNPLVLVANNGDIGSVGVPLSISGASSVDAAAIGSTGGVHLSTPDPNFHVGSIATVSGDASIAGPVSGGFELMLDKASIGGSFAWSGFSTATLGLGGGTIEASGPITADGNVALAGTLIPGKVGGISSMTINGGDFTVLPGAILKFDLVNTSYHDQITVLPGAKSGGNAYFPTGTANSSVVLNASAQPPNGEYTLISGTTSGTDNLPLVSGNVAGATLKFGSLIAVIDKPPPAVLVDTIADLLGGDRSSAQQVVAETDTTPLVIFTELAREEEEKQRTQAKDNVTDNTCSR